MLEKIKLYSENFAEEIFARMLWRQRHLNQKETKYAMLFRDTSPTICTTVAESLVAAFSGLNRLDDLSDFHNYNYSAEKAKLNQPNDFIIYQFRISINDGYIPIVDGNANFRQLYFLSWWILKRAQWLIPLCSF